MIGKPLDELRDQTAHLVMGIVALAPLIAHPAWFTAAFAGFSMGLSRELGEMRPPLTMAKIRTVFSNQKFDLMFWTISGITAFLVFGVTQ